MDVAFRTAAETTSPLDSFSDVSKTTTSRTILAETDSSAGLFTHEAVKGSPMTADYFNMKTFWDSPTSDMQDSIKEVDQWVQDKARERNMSDSKASYDEIVNNILKQIGKSANEKPHNTFERVAKAIEAYKRLEEAKLPTILNVKSMTPDEYKKTRA